MVKIIVCGVAGRMGSVIYNLAKKDKNFIISGLTEAENHPLCGKKVDEYTVISDLNKIIDKTDVVIDFTTPSSTLSNIEIAQKHNKNMVIGTTGFSQNEMELIKEKSKKIAVVLSPNMSIGVNLLFKLVEKTAEVLKDFDTEIIEIHHNKKKDAPSGTAKKIAEIISKKLSRNLDKNAVYGRKGITGERKQEEIGILSVRAGDIVGEHTVIFAGTGERIELIHRAYSRDTFGRGALLAASWVKDKKNGFWTMENVLGF